MLQETNAAVVSSLFFFRDAVRPPFLNFTLVPALFFIRKRMNHSSASLNRRLRMPYVLQKKAKIMCAKRSSQQTVLGHFLRVSPRAPRL